jgi:hypothetical protein
MLKQVKGHAAFVIQSDDFTIDNGPWGKRREGLREPGKISIE